MKSGVGGLVLAAAAMQDRLRVSAGLLRAFEDEFLGSLERDVGIEIRCHVAVLGVALVLTVDNRGHALECTDNVALADDAVTQPVGE